ncbi:MAG: hypothetical protein ACTH7I_02170, partial [Pseudoalteromonas nigrifaciens]
MLTKILNSLRVGALSLMAILTLSVHAQSALPETGLTVGVAGDAPFVIHNPQNNSLEGISLTIWENIA